MADIVAEDPRGLFASIAKVSSKPTPRIVVGLLNIVALVDSV